MALVGGGVVGPGGEPAYPVNPTPGGGGSGGSGGSGGGTSGGSSGSISGSGGPVTAPPVDPPIPDFDYTVYAGGLVAFENTSFGLISSYLWSFGDNRASYSPSPLHQYEGSGTFPVTLIVANASGQKSKTVNVTIPALPIVETVDFTFVVSALGAKFTDTSTKAGTRHWDFGDGTTSTETNPYKLYDLPGIYTVSLTITGVSASYQVPVDTGIVLNWVDNSNNETGFKVEHSPTGAVWSLLATVGAGVETLVVTQNLHDIDPGVENHFRVYAYNAYGDSATTNEVETLCEAS